jgi:hypothetical protein
VAGKAAGSSMEAIRVGIGVGIISVGVPVAWIARDLLRGGKSPVFTALLLLFGIALMADYAALRRGILRASRAELGFVLAPILVITALAFLIVQSSHGAAAEYDKRQVLDDAVLAAMVFAGMSSPVSMYRISHRGVAAVGVVAGAAALLYAVTSIGSLVEFAASGRFGGIGNGNESSAPLVVGKIAVLTLAAAWIWFREENKQKYLPAFALLGACVFAIPMLILSHSRTNMIGAGFVLILAGGVTLIRRVLYPQQKRRRKRGVTRVDIVLFVFAVAVIAALWHEVGETLGSYAGSAVIFLKKGTLSLFSGGNSASALGSVAAFDASASDRRTFLAHALDTFQLTGHGFKAVFLDDPVLGAFCDLGLLLGAAYVLVVVLVPLKICLDLSLRAVLPAFIKYSMVAYLLQLPLLFLSNTPYTSLNWQFVILFYVIAGRYWGRTRQSQQPLRHGAAKT